MAASVDPGAGFAQRSINDGSNTIDKLHQRVSVTFVAKHSLSSKRLAIPSISTRPSKLYRAHCVRCTMSWRSCTAVCVCVCSHGACEWLPPCRLTDGSGGWCYARRGSYCTRSGEKVLFTKAGKKVGRENKVEIPFVVFVDVETISTVLKNDMVYVRF